MNEQHFTILPKEVWLDTQLSLARHYGAIYFQDILYVVTDNDELLRSDLVHARVKDVGIFKEKVSVSLTPVSDNLPKVSPYDHRAGNRFIYNLRKQGVFLNLNILPRITENVETGETKVMIPANSNINYN